MIYLVLCVLFNAFMLAFLIDFPFMYTPQYTSMLMSSCVFNYALVASLTLIGYTKLGSSFIGIFLPGRKLIGKEKQQLTPLFDAVVERVNSIYGTKYSGKSFKLRISDSKDLNAFASGYDTITITRACLKRFSDGQLQALLAHELGHIHYKDSLRLSSLIFGSFGTRVVMWVYAVVCFIQRICSGISYANLLSRSDSSAGVGVFASILGYGLVVLFLPVYILNWLGGKLFYLFSKKMSRITEYRADEFAASIGYKNELISVLEIFDETENNDNSFQSKLMATHPATMLRVGALEDGMTQKEKLGTVLGAVPGATKIVGKIDGFNVYQLAGILILIGLFISGLNIWAYSYTSGKSFRQNFKDINVLSHQKNAPDIANDTTKITKEHDFSLDSAKLVPIAKPQQNKEHIAKPQHKKIHKAVKTEDDGLHITNVYKISDNQYSIQYDYKGEHGVLIKKQAPHDGVTMNELNSMQ